MTDEAADEQRQEAEGQAAEARHAALAPQREAIATAIAAHADAVGKLAALIGWTDLEQDARRLIDDVKKRAAG